ncbi:hypothetical protein [Falsiroseomonas sp.]|uniref:hypothetical protein n=1 Tax=Falsiroseomonas sp. TaxID=2870721 RepID=UPI00271F3D7E|nr:hypothetical protein [Falsiroseomonas sp.]MDO9502254.1 hypothetical protein [Falsiroseomonas sp.]MDP3418161.1 hypothetical protein [Falsiroseomonas sp.]
MRRKPAAAAFVPSGAEKFPHRVEGNVQRGKVLSAFWIVFQFGTSRQMRMVDADT